MNRCDKSLERKGKPIRQGEYNYNHSAPHFGITTFRIVARPVYRFTFLHLNMNSCCPEWVGEGGGGYGPIFLEYSEKGEGGIG